MLSQAVALYRRVRGDPRLDGMRLALPFGPHWYAAVMGTGIVAIALDGLPFAVRGTAGVALAFWLVASALLVAVTVVFARHVRTDRTMVRRQLDDPAVAPFFGAPAMALLTVGAGAVVVGQGLLGEALAVRLDAMLWTLGTLLGVITAVGVPYRAIVHHDLSDDSASGAWLMPVVPPMVSATTGAALVPHLHAGQPRETMLLACYAFFGISVIAGFLVLNQIWQRLLRHGAPAAATAPTVWIVLGFLGQSTTAAHHLGALAPDIVPQYGDALRALTICYGVPVWGFTLLWLGLAVLLTMRQVRDGLPFAPSWWSFTFPVGTVVTGTSALALATGLLLFEVVAAVVLLLLLTGWLAAAGGTARALLSRPRAGARPAPVASI